MLAPHWLKIVCCPESRQSLQEATKENLVQINYRIQKEGILNRSGQLISEPIEALLIRDDGKFGYPIREGIPVLLQGEALILVG